MSDQMLVTEVVKVKSLGGKLKALINKRFDEILKNPEADVEVREFVERVDRDSVEFIRKSWVTPEDIQFDDGERAVIHWVSTIDVDRDKEIMLPSGAVLTEFERAPQVLWGHNYDLPPHAKDRWIKKYPKKNSRGILAKTVYAETERGNELWILRKGGFLNTSSIGFIPIKYVNSGDKEYDKLCDTIETSGYSFDRTSVRRICTKWLMLEHSDVSVPANIEALTVAVAKGLNLSSDLCDELGICETEVQSIKQELVKAVIPYADYGSAPEGTDWDAGAEIRAADVNDLKIMSTWYDAENVDIKSAYKLPHHRASGRHAAIWRGIAAAMAVLLGARGGVAIPTGDRRSAYNHLKKHYAAWDKEAPEFRDYVEAELKIMFADLWDDILYLNYPDLKPFPNEHSCRLLSPDGWDRVRRQNDRFGPGIHAIFGIKENTSHLQAIRFDKTKFTAAQARKWSRDHDHTCILFEPASESRNADQRELEAIVEHIAGPDVVEKVASPKEPEVEVMQVERKEPAIELVPEPVERPLVELVKQELGRQLGKV